MLSPLLLSTSSQEVRQRKLHRPQLQFSAGRATKEVLNHAVVASSTRTALDASLRAALLQASSHKTGTHVL